MTIPPGDMCDGCPVLERREDAVTWYYCSRHKVILNDWRTRFGDLHVEKCGACRDEGS